MNSKFVADTTSLKLSMTLAGGRSTSRARIESKIETLYLAALYAEAEARSGPEADPLRQRRRPDRRPEQGAWRDVFWAC